ncbi:MAG: DUF87 domain-containing protein [Oscillospiraceae bacterium]|nr:DUF87 domain-containing protein [Oscillospiraceae bacterium]
MNYYPADTAAAVRLTGLVKHRETPGVTERMSTRMVKCAAVLNAAGQLGWQMAVPRKGLADLSVFGSAGLCREDLEWIVEKTGRTAGAVGATGKAEERLTELYELCLPVAEGGGRDAAIGFGTEVRPPEEVGSRWPVRGSAQFAELVRVLQSTGAVFRAAVGPAAAEDQALCRKNTLRTWTVTGVDAGDYIGTPVRARFLLLLPAAPTVRLRTILDEAVPGVRLRRLGSMAEREMAALWDAPLTGAAVLPDCSVRLLLMEPFLREPVAGIRLCEEETQKLPAEHRNTRTKGAVTIGRAVDVTGVRRRITVGETDLRRHYQIVGQTGTGKSTLLSAVICSAIEQGHGLTFFDPHGSTIDSLLRRIPERYAGRVRVVRLGDAENPVPLNIWDSDDPAREERNISDLCELFADIFDPKREGVVGPRYERWLSTFAKASIAFLGRRASLESIAVLSQSQDNMYKLCKAIIHRYPELAETIKEEYGTDKSSDFHNMLNWYLCKFQRLTAVEQLRKTLGAGGNALDFSRSIDTDTVTLIDLASPALGTHAARIVGTLLLMKLWNAAMARKERQRTHLVLVDEASLFQTNPMPRMLAESRKFGVAMVLCHQHTGQLTFEIQDALEANSANFSAFRLSPRDAARAAIRFDDPELQTGLTRLDAFNAITTLSVDGRQTAPFTLEIRRLKEQKNGREIAARIERSSIETLVKPYRALRALTPAEILDLLDDPRRAERLRTEATREDMLPSPGPEDSCRCA